MDDSGQNENGRQRQDQYKSLHNQWLIPPHLMKDHHAMTMKFMSILAERDAAIQERNLAISEKKAALAERDMAIMHRDTAIAERNAALMERDNAIAALEYRESTSVNGSTGNPRATKHMHHPQHMHHLSHLNESPYNYRDMNICEAIPISAAASEAVKPRKAKRVKEVKTSLSKKNVKQAKKGKRGSEDLNRQIPFAKTVEWKNEQCIGGCEDLNKQLVVSKAEWKCQDLGLNEVAFDDSTMPVPGCSCTGVFQHCYKWGKGGWQSACCTTTLSMYPLPVMPNKRHARLGGRKMSGSAFGKLLSRLASEGHDLSSPLDLKDHWAKHGTNRYITIR